MTKGWRMGRRLQHYCRECGCQARVTHSEKYEDNDDYIKIYACCTNPNCGHRWVSHLQYSHTTQKSKLSENGLFSFLIKKLPRKELEALGCIINQQLKMAD